MDIKNSHNSGAISLRDKEPAPRLRVAAATNTQIKAENPEKFQPLYGCHPCAYQHGGMLITISGLKRGVSKKIFKKNYFSRQNGLKRAPPGRVRRAFYGDAPGPHENKPPEAARAYDLPSTLCPQRLDLNALPSTLYRAACGARPAKAGPSLQSLATAESRAQRAVTRPPRHLHARRRLVRFR